MLLHALPERAAGLVPVGTLGASAVIHRLVTRRRLGVSQVQGCREAPVTQVVEWSAPGADRALVMAGTDQRGTVYGVDDTSESIGVSSRYWWAEAHLSNVTVPA